MTGDHVQVMFSRLLIGHDVEVADLFAQRPVILFLQLIRSGQSVRRQYGKTGVIPRKLQPRNVFACRLVFKNVRPVHPLVREQAGIRIVRYRWNDEPQIFKIHQILRAVASDTEGPDRAAFSAVGVLLVLSVPVIHAVLMVYRAAVRLNPVPCRIKERFAGFDCALVMFCRSLRLSPDIFPCVKAPSRGLCARLILLQDPTVPQNLCLLRRSVSAGRSAKLLQCFIQRVQRLLRNQTSGILRELSKREAASLRILSELDPQSRKKTVNDSGAVRVAVNFI